MPVTKSHDETLTVAGACPGWFKRCVEALEQARFSRIRADEESFIIDADYKGFTVDGSIRVLLTEQGDMVNVEVRVIAAVDNVWDLFKPAVKRVTNAFKDKLGVK